MFWAWHVRQHFAASLSHCAVVHLSFVSGVAMQRLSIYLLLGLLATFCLTMHSLAEPAKPEKETASADQPKPEELLRQMSDYLGKLPAFSCRMEATLEIKPEKEDPMQEVTKMTA